jgi:transposase
MDLSNYNQKKLFGADVMLDNFLEPDDICATIQKEIAPLIRDTDFEDMYRTGGRPPISPKVMLLNLIMQFLEKII